jgi:superfamily II DNA or RNA helicase
MPDSLFCTPEPRLATEADASLDLREAFAQTDAKGVLLLATAKLEADLDPPAAWAREWGRLFLARVCQTRDPQSATLPDAMQRLAFLASAPPMRGSEYVSDQLLSRLWTDLQGIVTSESVSHPGGLEAWLRGKNPLWHLVGRVTFHLAENKRNEQLPFAFLATYTEKLSASGAPQHTPLGRALQNYSVTKDQAALDSLLAPVRIAADRSKLVHRLLESRQLFQAAAWTPSDAYHFIREIPLLEECGLIIKVPDWWKERRPSRPQISITVDAAKNGGLGVGAMLSFRAGYTLDGETLTEKEWAQIKATPSGLVNLKGRWVEIDQRRLDQVLNHWQRVESAHAEGLSFHEGMRWLAGFRAGEDGPDAESVLNEIDATLEWSEVIAGKGLQALLEGLREPPMTLIPGLRATLRPYQQRGVDWLYFCSSLGLGACLADDMGLGKTLQVIALLCIRAEETKGDRRTSLLIVPASLIGNWCSELARFAPHLRIKVAHTSGASREELDAMANDPHFAMRDCDVLLTTYGQWQRSSLLAEHDWDLVVIDEAQAIKNATTAQARAVKRAKARARIALTGTPIENKLGDLWSLFDFLNPGLLGKSRAFADATKQWSDAKNRSGFAPLRRLIQPYLLRRMKTDKAVVSDLPDKIEIKALCPLKKKQAILYGKLVEQLKADLANEDLDPNQRRGLVLGYLIKFKQVCNHPSHWSGDQRYEASESGKFQRLTEIATELAERQERCLVFTQFREMTAPLAAHLATIFGRPGLVLHGGTPVGQRQKLVEDFQRIDGPPFFVLSVKAGGTGLTLTAASHVIHFDRWWNPAVENQATDRAFRIGQKKNVLVHKFVCPGTIEEKVDALIADKNALAEDILDGEGAAKILTEMSNSELLDFVKLDIGKVLDGSD